MAAGQDSMSEVIDQLGDTAEMEEVAAYQKELMGGRFVP